MDDLVEKLSSILLAKELILTTAESCTGGMISSEIIAREGASKIFDRGFITYTDAAKKEMLNVADNIINTYGAVSEQCANAMVLGALDNSHADIAVSITGIAGPEGGTTDKPVGLVYIGSGFSWGEPKVTAFNFSGTRDEIRQQSCKAALEILIKLAESYDS